MNDDLSEQDSAKVESVQNLIKILQNESDRGCCLLAVSFLDNELKHLLEDKLIGNKKFKKQLFNLQGPLSSFSSKIDLAYSTGLISDFQKRDIHKIRRIRNIFGHSYEQVDFDSSNIRSMITDLQYNFYEDGEFSARYMFIAAVTIILTEIHEILEIHSQFDEMKNREYLNDSKLRRLVRQLNQKLYNID